MRIAVALVTLLGIVCSSAHGERKKPPKPLGERVATMSKAVDAKWPKQGAEPKLGSAIRANQAVALDSGRAELALEGGGTVTLVGPCSLTWTGPYRARVKSGKIEIALSDTASLALDGAGFNIQTSGSRFDVDVSAGRSTVSVHAGSLYVKGRGKDGGVQYVERGERIEIDQKTGAGKTSKLGKSNSA